MWTKVQHSSRESSLLIKDNIILRNMLNIWQKIRKLEGYSNCFSLLTAAGVSALWSLALIHPSKGKDNHYYDDSCSGEWPRKGKGEGECSCAWLSEKNQTAAALVCRQPTYCFQEPLWITELRQTKDLCGHHKTQKWHMWWCKSTWIIIILSKQMCAHFITKFSSESPVETLINQRVVH